MLDKILKALKTVDDNVYYWRNPHTNEWNYTVFTRTKTEQTPTGRNEYFSVACVRENYIPEGLDLAIIEAVTNLEGVRKTKEDITFTCSVLPNTTAIIEIMEIRFAKVEKNG